MPTITGIRLTTGPEEYVTVAITIRVAAPGRHSFRFDLDSALPCFFIAGTKRTKTIHRTRTFIAEGEYTVHYAIRVIGPGDSIAEPWMIVTAAGVDGSSNRFPVVLVVPGKKIYGTRDHRIAAARHDHLP
jgi:hypothetical protein